MSTMPGLLTDLYDCKDHRESPGTLKTGPMTHENVYVTFLSASTPAWLVTAINPSVIEGGFTSRVIFVVDDARKRAIAWPKQRKEDHGREIADRFVKTVEVARGIGPIAISKGGLKKFTSWYNSRATHNDPFQSSFEAREDDHLLRVAACLAVNDGIHEIQSRHIRIGSKVISQVKSSANRLFGGDFSERARIAGGLGRVRDILIAAGSDGIKHSDLQRRITRRLDAAELRLLINVMHECGMVQIFKTGRGHMYRATRAIEKFGVTTEVLGKLNLSGD